MTAGREIDALVEELVQAFDQARMIDSGADFWPTVGPILDAHQALGGEVINDALARFAGRLREREQDA